MPLDSLEPVARRHRRPPTKRRLIVQTLRKEIVTGTRVPGSQLPTRTELVTQFAASSITVQAALDRLGRDGFVVARGRQGTFVAERPPHLFNFGLVFPTTPSSPGWAKHWTALSNEAHAMEADTPRRFKLYHGIESGPENPTLTALINDARAQRLAGVIFTAPPSFLGASPLIQERAVPMVSMSIDGGSFPGMPSVTLDYRSLVDKALDDLAARGAKRVACLMISQMGEAFINQVVDGIVARGMRTRREWMQGMPISPGIWVSQLAMLLMQGPSHERPDGLFIADDNLIEPATAGIVSAGITDPRDLKITAHCNFPWPVPSHFPVRRVGFDMRQTLRSACDLIERARAGLPLPEMTRQVAMFETEIGTLAPSPSMGEGTRSLPHPL